MKGSLTLPRKGSFSSWSAGSPEVQQPPFQWRTSQPFNDSHSLPPVRKERKDEAPRRRGGAAVDHTTKVANGETRWTEVGVAGASPGDVRNPVTPTMTTTVGPAAAFQSEGSHQAEAEAGARMDSHMHP